MRKFFNGGTRLCVPNLAYWEGRGRNTCRGTDKSPLDTQNSESLERVCEDFNCGQASLWIPTAGPSDSTDAGHTLPNQDTVRDLIRKRMCISCS